MKLRKTVISILLLAVLVGAWFPISAQAAECTSHSYSNGICTVCEAFQEPTLSGDVYQLSNAGHLYWFAAQVDAGNTAINGKLTTNITLTEDLMSKLIIATDGTAYIRGGKTVMVWTPIGDDSNYFEGTFDGNGKTISGLYFNDSSVYHQGLFSRSRGTIKNLTIDDSYFYGKGYVGAFVGYNSGTVIDCANYATVAGSYDIAGISGGGGHTERCFNAGEIYGYSDVAGICGSHGTAINCYNIGTVTGTSNVGGIVAQNGKIISCYNSGTVTGSDSGIGALMGIALNSTNYIRDSYYLAGSATDGDGTAQTGLSGTADTAESCTAVTAAQMASGEVAYRLNGSQVSIVWYQTCGTGTPAFSGKQVYMNGACAGTYSFSNTKGTQTHSYTNGFCVCGGYQTPSLSGGVYQIANAGNLYWFAEAVSGGNTAINAKLTANIVVNENLSSNVSVYYNSYSIKSGYTVRNWIPIGDSQDAYQGTFDGNGKTISGLFRADKDAALFHSVDSGATVKNVVLKDIYFLGGNYKAGVALYNKGTVTGCSSAGYVYGSSAGGMVYYNYGTVTNCTNAARVSGTIRGYFGGIVAFNLGKVNGCTNTADISGYGQIGGIVGLTGTTSEVSDCFNSGWVSGYTSTGSKEHVGGIVGADYGDVGILRCGNSGYIYGNYAYVGGIVGAAGNVIENCYNIGEVKGSDDGIGGIAGYAYETAVSDCYSSGTVGVTNVRYDWLGKYVGAIIGYHKNNNTVSNCFYLSGSAKDRYNATQRGLGCATQNSYTSDISGQTTSVSSTQLASGEVAYRLNGLTSEGDLVWYQDIGTDTTPFLEGAVVYKNQTGGCKTGYYTYGYANEKLEDVFSHRETTKAAVAATCTESGLTEGKYCSACSTVLVEQETVPATGHTEVTDAAVAPTCTEAGLTEGSHCDVCGEVFTAQETVDALGHNWSADLTWNWAEDHSGCTAVRSCTTCGGTEELVCTVTSRVIKAATCKEEGTVRYTAKVTIDSTTYSKTKEATLATTDHNYDNGFCTFCDAFQQPEGAGTAASPYLIDNAGKLYWFAAQVNADNSLYGDISICGKLTADIVVNENILNADASLNTSGEDFRDWTPIGSGYDVYTGTFDGIKDADTGEVYTISGLYSGEGLFRKIGEAGSVQNLGICDSFFSGDESGAVVGANYGNVTNCYNEGSVEGSSSVGGVVGMNYGAVTNCHNEGTICGSIKVGGVVGFNDGTVTDCHNAGNVVGSSSNGSRVGGVVGSNDGTVTDCHNEGAVSGRMNVGGVVGYCNEGSVVNSYNIGTVSVSTDGYCSGGVVGYNNNGTVANCYNVGAVSGDYEIGGVVGYHYGSVANCYYLSTEEINKNLGGISGNDVAGQAEARDADQFSGGEVAYLLSQGCTINGIPYAGGIWGQNIDNGEEAQSYPVFSDAWVYRNLDCGGNVAGYSNTEVEPEDHDWKVTFDWTEVEYDYVTGSAVCNVCTTVQDCDVELISTTKAPTCAEEGELVCTAKTVVEGKTFTEDKILPIAKLDHTPGDPVTEKEVAATCTAEGSYDTVTYCTVCGNEASRETTTVDALGHKDENSDYVCDVCEAVVGAVAQVGETRYGSLADAIAAGDEITLLANVEEAVTVSKAVTIHRNGFAANITAGDGYELNETDTAYVVAEKKAVEPYIKINTDNMELGNNLALIFWIKESELHADEEHVAVLTRSYADGTTEEMRVPMSDWVDIGAYRQVKYDNFAAKEMTDDLSIRIENADGLVVSNEFTDNIREYSMFMLGSSNDQKLKRAMVDMLNYGAAAQKAFGYKTNDLANSDLTAAHQALATQSVNPQDHWSNADGVGYSSNLELVSNIVLHIWMKDVTSDMYAVVRYTNHYGDVVEDTVPFSEFTSRENFGAGIYSVPVDELVVADGGQVVTCTLYRGDGTEYGAVTESVESYIAYMMSQNKDTNGLYEATMKFVTSAYSFFHVDQDGTSNESSDKPADEPEDVPAADPEGDTGEFEYNGTTVLVSTFASSALQNSSFADLGAEQLMKEVSNLVGLIAEDVVEYLGDSYLEALAGYLGADSKDELDMKLGEMGFSEEEIQTILNNGTVMYAAQILLDFSDTQIEAALNGEWSDDHAERFAQGALVYGLYTSYVANGGAEISGTPVSIVTSVVDVMEFRDYANSEQGQKDLEAFLAAMRVICENLGQTEIVEHVLVNGYDNHEAVVLMDAVMGG